MDHSPKGHKESDMTEQINTGHRIKSHNFSHNFSVPESSGYDLQKLFFFCFLKTFYLLLCELRGKLQLPS